MKKTVKYLAAAVLAVMAIVSCQKTETETPVSRQTHFVLNATSPETRTGIMYDEGSYIPFFQNGDEIGLFVNALPTKTGDMTTDAVFANSASDGADAQFEGTLEVDPGSVTFYSFYPASAGKKVYVNNETVTLGLDVPSTQHPAYDAGMGSYTFDPKADILIAKPATTTVDASHNAEATDMYFARLTAVLRVAVKAESNSSDVYGERIKSIKIETSAGHIAGRIVVNPLTGECTGVNEVGGSKAIEAVIDDPDDCSVYVGYEGSNIVFMGVAPVSIPSGSDLTFTINTIDATGKASHKIVKTVQDIENAIAFESSKPTVINLTVYNSEIGDPDEEDTTDYTGEWVIAGTQTNDYILSQFVSGNVYPAVEATSIDAENEIVTVVGSKTPYKLTIAKEAEGTYAGLYTIKDAANKYLTASATSASSQNYLTGVDTPVAGSYWSISKTEGVLDIIATKVDESYAREIRVNHNSGNNPRFSCYKASSTQPKVGLYPYSKVVEALEPAATPVISCDNNTITIACATSGASIYYTLGTTAENTADPTAESTLYDADNKPTITADAYIKAIAIAEGFENSEIAAQALTYVDASTIYYVKVTAAPTDWSGDYLIVYDNGTSSKVLTGVSNNVGQQADVVITNSKIVASDYSDYNIVIAAGSTSGKYTMKLGNSYLAYTSTATSGSNNLYTVSSATANGSQWTLSVNDAQNVYNSNRYLRYNSGSPRFCCYTSGQQNISFYKLEDNRTEAPISWPNATEKVTKTGSAITWDNGSAPVLTNTEGLDVTYSAVPETVATITSAGVISIVGAGEATIKASYTGTTYKYTEATFTLTVTDATPYTITCNSNDNSYGTVTPSSTTATVGSTVTLTIAANHCCPLKVVDVVKS
ncbi:MAG: chitobiase/beta-hexosaminidase C-terminal domain-containing protein [Bacteroidales bacterium]|nr:chitobiase/beta-hexosaminidase C-terminal domain-containing protein [Bacteroidales bacterium]